MWELEVKKPELCDDGCVCVYQRPGSPGGAAALLVHGPVVQN